MKPATLPEPARTAIDDIQGKLLIEFGASWCSHCQAAQTHLNTALSEHPDYQHIRIEDGKGRRLGRSFGIKLWPTLVVLRDGVEISRVVRPQSVADIQAVLRIAD